MGTYKIGELSSPHPPWHNALGFSYWGRSIKMNIEIKKGVMYSVSWAGS
jgi:hypothetical protein